MSSPYERKLRANRRAWEYFQEQAPWYRRTCTYWVMSAKREETRVRRLELLIDCSAQNTPIPALARTPKKKP